MIKIFKKYPGWILILTGIIMLVPGFALLDVSIMEARNFISAREMILDDNWIMTTMNGEPRYQKPPLPTWLTALSMAIFGGSKLLWLRLPGIIMVGLCGIMIHRLSRNLNLGDIQSNLNALVAMTSFYVVAIVIEAPWDIYTHVFMGFSLLFLVPAVRSKQGLFVNLMLSGLFFGASVLSKGPIAVYALFLPFLIAYGLTFGYKKSLPTAGKILSVILLGLVFGGWWYLVVRLNDPVTFEAMANKETANWSSYNVRPFYYYWSFFTQSGIWTIPALMGLIYPYMIKRVEDKKAYRFTWLWTIIAVVLLSLIPEKKSRYLMPVLIPLAINTGFYLQYIRNSALKFSNRNEAVPIYFLLFVLGLIGLGFPAIAYVMLKSSSSVNWTHIALVSLVFIVLGILCFRSIYRKDAGSMINIMIGFAIAVVFLLPPLSAYLGDGNYKPMNSLSESVKTKGIGLYQSGALAPEFIWQYGGKIPSLDLNTEPLLNSNVYYLSQDEKGGDIPDDLYKAELIESYDLNRNSEGRGRYRERLSVYLFEVAPK